MYLYPAVKVTFNLDMVACLFSWWGVKPVMHACQRRLQLVMKATESEHATIILGVIEHKENNAGQI